MEQPVRGGSRLIFCTGGCRSGKSAFALKLAANLPGRKLFVATAEPLDAEMRERIRRHREERGPEWDCLEIPVGEAFDLAISLAQTRQDVLLLDCVSSWVSACLCAYPGLFEPAPEPLTMEPPAPEHPAFEAPITKTIEGAMAELAREAEQAILESFQKCLRVLRQRGGEILLVSAETGLGLVPSSLAGRVFRDILGLVNQEAAQYADEAYLVVCGLPLRLK